MSGGDPGGDPSALPRVIRVVHNVRRNPVMPFAAKPLTHPEHVISVLIRGAGRYGIGPKTVDLRAPTLSVLAAGQKDRNELLGAYESWFVIFLWPGLSCDESGAVRLATGRGPVRLPQWRPISPAEAACAVSIFRNLKVTAARPGLAADFEAAAQLLKLLALLARGGTPLGASGREPAVDLFRQLIEQHACDAEVSLSELAGRVGYSPEHLAGRFNAAMGMTPVAHRTQLRLARAQELLLGTELPVKEVAREVGWPDANYFARAFRRGTGRSPAAFRRLRLSPPRA